MFNSNNLENYFNIMYDQSWSMYAVSQLIKIKNINWQPDFIFFFFTLENIMSPYGYLYLLSPSELKSPGHSALIVLVAIQFNKMYWNFEVECYIRQNKTYKRE